MKNEDISLATKQKIAEALKYYMRRKDFQKITVKEILAYADITRPTFYYHFADIYAAMQWMFDRELLELLKKSDNIVSWDEGILLVLQYVEDNRDICLCAYNSVGRDLLQQLFRRQTEEIMKKFVDGLTEKIKADPEDTAFIIDFYTMALVSALIQWMLKPEGRSPQDMLAKIDVAIHGAIRAARMAVYQLCGSHRQVLPVKPICYDIRMLIGAAAQFLK